VLISFGRGEGKGENQVPKSEGENPQLKNGRRGKIPSFTGKPENLEKREGKVINI